MFHSKSFYIFSLLAVFIIFLFFRAYNLNHRVIFDWDQERDAYQIKKLIVEKKPTLIGPRVLGPEGFHLGPYYTYILSPFYAMTNLHPSGSVLFLTAYNIVFFSAAAIVIGMLFGNVHVLAFLALWSLNFLLIFYDTTPVNTLLLPLGVILLWYLLYRVYKQTTPRNWLLAGLGVGLWIHFHFQFIFLIPFVALVLWYARKETKPTGPKIAVCLLGFFAPMLPLVLFDLRHDFLNTKSLINFFSGGDQPKDMLVWIPVVANFLEPLTVRISEFFSGLLYAGLIGATFFLTTRRTEFLKHFYHAAFWLWIIVPIGFAMWGARPSEYYFTFLYPFILIVIVDFFLTVKKPIILAGIIALLTLTQSTMLKNSLKNNTLGLFYKDQAIKELSVYKDKKINVSFNIPLDKDRSYSYLLEHYNIPQSGNPKDLLIEIVIPPDNVQKKFGEIGLRIPKELK